MDITEILTEKGSYTKGLKSGRWVTYAGEFKLSSIAYKKGVKSGKLIYYHPNGATYIKGRYKNGKQEGIGFVYTISGNLKYKEYFENDSLIRREKVIED